MSGKDIFHFKMQSLIFGSMVMGAGGALSAHYMKTVSPDMFTPLYGTFIIWVMLIAGGSGNNKGAILGAYVIWGVWIGTQLLTDYLPLILKARAPYIRFLIIGVILEIILLYRPQGLLGEEKKVSRMLELAFTGSGLRGSPFRVQGSGFWVCVKSEQLIGEL
jgi:branched-chain amino acid transport system permease protein